MTRSNRGRQLPYVLLATLAIALSACGGKPKASPTFTRVSATASPVASPTPAPECLATAAFTGDLSGSLTVRVNSVQSGSELRIEGQAPSGLGSNLAIDLLVDIEPFHGAGTYPVINDLSGSQGSSPAATPSADASATGSAGPPAAPSSPAATSSSSATPSPTLSGPLQSSVFSLVFGPGSANGVGWSSAGAEGGAGPGAGPTATPTPSAGPTATGATPAAAGDSSVTVAADLKTVTIWTRILQASLQSRAATGRTATASVSVFCPQPLH